MDEQATVAKLNIADQIRAAQLALAPDGAAPLAPYLTVPDVADRYRTTPGTVRYWRHIGYGPNGTKVGTRVLYPRAEIERFDRELAARAAGRTA